MLCEALLLALAKKPAAIVVGVAEDDASSLRRDWRGEG